MAQSEVGRLTQLGEMRWLIVAPAKVVVVGVLGRVVLGSMRQDWDPADQETRQNRVDPLGLMQPYLEEGKKFLLALW